MDFYDSPSPKEMLSYYAVSIPLLCLVGYLFYNNLVIALIMAALSYPFRNRYVQYIYGKRKDELTKQFRDLVYSLSTSVGTGRPLAEALTDASLSMNLIYEEDSPICTWLASAVRRMKESKESEEALFNEFAEQSGIEDIRGFADIYSISRKTGGDLIRVLAKTAEILLDKGEIQKEIQNLTAQKRLESRIISAMPLLLIIFLKFTSPDYLLVMYETAAGRILMSGALILLCLSCCIMSVLCRIKV
jgi:tight adherence protein B